MMGRDEIIQHHAEARHLHEHLAFARRLEVPQPIEARNGDLVRLAPGQAEVLEQVPTGRLVPENSHLLAANDELYRTRRRLMAHGTILVGLVQLQGLATITAGPAALAFAAVVILTMVAAMSFEPRLIWDPLEEQDARTGT